MSQAAAAKLYFAGVDIGSNAAKSVILADDRIIGQAIVPTKADVENSGKTALKAALESAGISDDDLSYTVATGYGRISASYADEVITEITCHAQGAHYFFPN